MAGLYLAAFASVALCDQTRIRDIQGRGHESPLAGKTVETVPGIVTAVRPHGFYMQDDLPDTDPFTSEGVFVYTAAPAGVSVGDSVTVSGKVTEFCASGGRAGSTNIRLEAIETLARGVALPPPIVLGPSGTRTPDERIADFDPALYLPAFYERLEGMRVSVQEARIVGPASGASVTVVPEGVYSHRGFSPRGALLIQERHDNAQRLMLYRPHLPSQAKVGDRLDDVAGVLDQASAFYAVWLDADPSWRPAFLPEESARVAEADELSIAAYNVENLDVGDPPLKFERIAAHIVRNLRAPDIVGLVEVQDDSGARDDGVTNAALTLEKLIDAIRRIGGPAYAWSAVDPMDNADGGQPGGNIRQVLLFHPQRVGLKSPSRRIGAEDGAFAQSRKPLVATFDYRGRPLTVILNHFVSKRGDPAGCGKEAGTRPSSEPQRLKQAQIVADHVRGLLARDAQARVVVMGDLNDFEFSAALRVLEKAGLANALSALPPLERYSYIHEGNAQMLDHALLSASLSAAFDFDVVHVNAEYPLSQRPSDHDPLLLRLRLP